MTEIRRAMDRMVERKEAAAIDRAGEIAADEKSRLVFVGLGLDYDELLDCAMRMAYGGVQVLYEGMPVVNTLASGWADGVAVGLLIAEARRHEHDFGDGVTCVDCGLHRSVVGDGALTPEAITKTLDTGGVVTMTQASEGSVEERVVEQSAAWLLKLAQQQGADIVVRRNLGVGADWSADMDWPWGETASSDGESAADAVVALALSLAEQYEVD